MAKRKKEVSEQEQLDLIDVRPENAKAIISAAKRYKKVQAERIAALEVEVKEKQNLLTLIKGANLHPTDDGNIRFRIDGLTITVTPRDELVKVKEEGNEE